MILTDIGLATPIFLQVKDRSVDKGVKAELKDMAGNVISTINLPHKTDGLYVSSFTPTEEAFLLATYTVYTDTSYTVIDYYETITTTYRVTKPCDPDELVDKIWDEPLSDHLSVDSTGRALWDILSGIHALPETVANAVWDEPVLAHTDGGTFGIFVQIIRTSGFEIVAELLSADHGLEKINEDILNGNLNLKNEVNINESKIDLIIPAINAGNISIHTHLDTIDSDIYSVSSQVGGVESSLAAEILENRAKIDQLIGSVGSLQNNTTVRFIVPERLIKPTTGNKTYQFYLYLYDENGNPKAPDFSPVIKIVRIDTGAIVANGSMTNILDRVGGYYFDFTISSGIPDYSAVVEAAITNDGIERYVPSATEITVFETDLNALQAQVSTVQLDVTGIKSKVDNGIYGLSALRTEQTVIESEINQNEILLSQIKSKTDHLPVYPASVSDVQAVNNSVLTRPTISEIQSRLDLLRSAIAGVDNRNLTDVYDHFDISTLLKINDPRLVNLDAPISSRGTLTAAQVWGFSTRTLTDFILSEPQVKKIWDYLASQAIVPGSIGKRIADLLDASISSRATASQVSSLLSGVAQESTISLMASLISDGFASTNIDIDEILSQLATIRSKTNNLPSSPASTSTVQAGANSILLDLANLSLSVDSIKLKTDALPADPAKETSVQQRPTNPLLTTDARLNNLDVKVSTRSTLKLSDLSGLATNLQLQDVKNILSSDIGDMENSINDAKLYLVGIKAKTDKLPIDPASSSDISQAEDNIIDSMPEGALLTAADIWSYPTRLITNNPNDFKADISNLATKGDVSNINHPQYINRLSTTFNNITGEQEVIVWAEKNGCRVVGSNCTITIKNSSGVTTWGASSSTPNIDGVFKFINPVALNSDSNYYVVISIFTDGLARVNQQSFFTIG
jgi:hypothetical protein